MGTWTRVAVVLEHGQEQNSLGTWTRAAVVWEHGKVQQQFGNMDKSNRQQFLEQM